MDYAQYVYLGLGILGLLLTFLWLGRVHRGPPNDYF